MNHQGEILKQLLQDNGYTQATFAPKIKVSRNQLNIICKQTKLGKYLQPICKALNVDPSAFSKEVDNTEVSHLKEIIRSQADHIESLKETISILKQSK